MNEEEFKKLCPELHKALSEKKYFRLYGMIVCFPTEFHYYEFVRWHIERESNFKEYVMKLKPINDYVKQPVSFVRLSSDQPYLQIIIGLN